MKSVKETIVSHFIEEHKRLLGGAALSPGQVHPNEISQVGDINLNPSGSNGDGLDFTASFQVGRTKVFYFGTITDDSRIVNEGVAGRNADGSLPK